MTSLRWLQPFSWIRFRPGNRMMFYAWGCTSQACAFDIYCSREKDGSAFITRSGKGILSKGRICCSNNSLSRCFYSSSCFRMEKRWSVISPSFGVSLFNLEATPRNDISASWRSPTSCGELPCRWLFLLFTCRDSTTRSWWRLNRSKGGETNWGSTSVLDKQEDAAPHFWTDRLDSTIW